MVVQQETHFNQMIRTYMEQLQILFRYNANQSILKLFDYQLKSIPELYARKVKLLGQQGEAKMAYPDIHTICLVVKCLIREKNAELGLHFTQLLKEHSNLGRDDKQNEMNVRLRNQDYQNLIHGFLNIKHILTYDINTFFLNGIIIELNSRHLYEFALKLFQWMEQNTNINHRPNTSTYNMIILVYGSMQQYNHSIALFDSMQKEWHQLNDNLNNLSLYQDIYNKIISHKKAKS